MLEEALLSTEAERLVEEDLPLREEDLTFSSDSDEELRPTACAVDLLRLRERRFLKFRNGRMAEKWPWSS